ncbi:hypothetical protein L3Y34_015376 [Caenorhabditis briggsae]|uniref:non-specific serine/threonine protein kinase n=1 Tax=Caenorhabditis briggsae TaxID=6238 RepID=A0AAE9DVX1_CAEBR|nr:hypothetical protein L3Y34_015376 [Caenorhabditis briggsae]
MATICELVQLPVGSECGKWTVLKKLGEGAFGAVYLVNQKGKPEVEYALKVEAESDPLGLLKMEVAVLLEVKKQKITGRHFLELADRGNLPGKFYYMVMTLVGKSLQDLRKTAPFNKFSMGTAISVARQSLEAVEDLHSIGFLHRDIKPGNYTIGRKEMHELRKVYMLDFGMARKFAREDGTLRNPRARAGFRGTVKYAPLACHIQREQCRKDDIESWLYMVVEMTSGRLPWRNLTESDDVGVFKKECKTTRQRCLFGGCPREYMEVFPILDKGKFFDAPEYKSIYDLLNKAMENTKANEFPYDWE